MYPSISIYFMTQCNITNYRKLCKPYENLYLLNYILSCKYISFRFFKNYNTPTFLRAFFLASMTVHNLSIVSAILFVFCLSINISVKVESNVLPISSKPMLFKSALLSSTQLIPPCCAFLCCHFALLPLILSWLLCLAYDSQAVGAKRVSLYCPPIGPQCTRSSVLFNGWWKVYCVCFHSTDRRFSAQSHCPLHIQRHTETHRSHTHSYRFAFLSGARLTPLYSQPCTLHLFHSS